MKKKQLSEDTRVRISIVDLIKSEKPDEYLSTVRIQIDPDHYKKAIEQIEQYPFKVTNLLGAHPKEFRELDFHNLLPLSFEKELTWAKTVLYRNVEGINKFINFSNLFSSELLRGNYTRSKIVLDEMESELGQSMWLIKNRIAFLQLTEGLESQKQYTKKVKEELRDRSLVKFVIHWTSIRNEGKTTLNKFTTQFEPIINRFDPIKLLGYKEYCTYHVLGTDTINHEEFANVLRLEYSRSLVDYYEAFVSLLRITLISDDEKLKSKVKYIVETASELINDQRLYLFRSILGDRTKSITKESIESCDTFLQGNYCKAMEQAMSALNNAPDNPMLILQASHAKASLNENQIAEENETNSIKTPLPINKLLINNIANVIRDGAIGASRELKELNKLSINFSCFPWASIIKIIVSQETTIFSPLDSEGVISVLKIPYIHPLLIELTKNSSIYTSYLELCSETYEKTLSMEYMLAKAQKRNNLAAHKTGENSSKYLNGIVSFLNNRYPEAIYSGKYLATKTLGYYTRKGIGLVTHSYLLLQDLENACISTAEFYLKDKNNYPFLPIKELFQSIKSGTDKWDRISSYIDFSIVLDAYVKHISLNGETERTFAYEDFLLSNGMTRPSELKERIQQFDRGKLIYYLRNICIEANMDTSIAFAEGSAEVTAERLAVCKILAEIDPTNIDEYQIEVNDLVKRQIIKNRRQEVDQSRIYIDLVSVKEWVSNNVEEDYDRYIAYRKHGLDFDEPEGNKKIKQQNLMRDTNTLPNILIPENEVNGLLGDIMEEIVSAYLSPEFGLDRFLSTRIRHGILEGHLRRPIAEHRLITKKASIQGPYLQNDYWVNKLNITDLPILNSLNKILNTFSTSYDNLILKITTEWLQVKSAKKQNGLFNFLLTKEDISNIASVITPETTFREFIDTVINSLEGNLILHLANIRKELHEKAKPEAKSYLKELEENISKYSNVININELLGAINQARTDMQAQFDKVIEWFVPSASGNSSPFTPEDAMRVAETIIMDSSPAFKINLSQDGLEDFLIHGSLPIFVDIFVNVFDNVVKRSGLEIPIANCQIWIENPSTNVNLVYFKIRNELKVNEGIEKVELELKRKKELLEKGDYNEYVSSEGNSGLFKIHKSVSDFRLVEYDLKATLDFGIVDNGFQIIVCVPFRIFQLESED